MSERIWTAAQSAAIDFDGGNLILSAAAGSGKTATLTERIIKAVISGGDISRMLIVTFTKAAAGELKSRIGSALEKAIAENPSNRHVTSQLRHIEMAHISTIDSFFLDEVKPYFSVLGLPPDFSVLDEAEAAVMKKEAMLDTVNAFFDQPSDGEEKTPFILLADCLSGARDEGSLDEALLSLRETVVARDTDPTALRRLADKCEDEADDFLASAFGAPLREHMRILSDHYAGVFEELLPAIEGNENLAKSVPEAKRCLSFAERLGTFSDMPYSEAAEAFVSFETVTLNKIKSELQTDEYLRFKSERTEFLGHIKSLCADFFGPGGAKCAEAMRKNAVICRAAADIIEEFENRYGKAKRERGKVDFTDLVRFSLSIFCAPDGSPTEAARAAGAKFDRIFIDEYQDTSAAQDRVFSAIAATTPRFMVGDVKQSIYGFRGACPELFTDYRRRYEAHDGGEAIFMSENFRSDKSIIGFANLVSEYIFSAGAAPFESEDRLITAKAGGEGCTPVSLCLVMPPECGEGEAQISAQDCETEYVAKQISFLVEHGRLKNGKRINPGDIAILMRSGTRAASFASELSALGIPVQNSATEHFFSYSEVLLILCLLNSTDNPLSDIYLAGAMKSPLCGFTLDELVNIRMGDRDPLWYSVKRYAERGEITALRDKCAAFISRLDGWRKSARTMYADEILRLIIGQTGILKMDGDGRRSTADIRRSVKIMMTHAASVAASGGGLHELIIYLNSLIERSDKADFAPDGGSVTIMTVHKSKGLEFPVCFLVGCKGEFNRRDSSDKTLFSPETGPAMKLYDDGGLVRCDTPLRRSLALKLRRDSTNEEARVLYVALTRASERLFITCAVKDNEKELEEASEQMNYRLSEYTVLTAGSFADWIVNAAVRNIAKAPGCFEIVKYTGGDRLPCDPGSAGAEEAENDAVPPFFDKIFEKTIDFASGREYLENIPAKLTVSKLSPDVLNIAGEERASLDAPSPHRAEKMRVPDFLSEEKSATPADAGVATHVFMQFCDFDALAEKGAEEELARLVSMGFITSRDASLVRMDEIGLFAKSSLLSRMRSATKMYREFRFNTVLPAWKFTTDGTLREKLLSDGTEITVQGVVDCMFVDSDGRAVLIDYKTDRLSADELSDRTLAEKKLLARHSRQLSVYRDVCAAMIGRDFDAVYIYSLPLGGVVEVPESETESGDGL